MGWFEIFLTLALSPWSTTVPSTVGAVAMGWIKKAAGGSYIDAILYGLVGAAAISVIYINAVIPYLESIPPSPERVSYKLENWIKNSRFKGNQTLPPQEDREFDYHFDYQDVKINVEMKKDNPAFINFYTIIPLDKNQQDWLNQKSNLGRDKLARIIRRDLLLYGINHEVQQILNKKPKPTQYQVVLVESLQTNNISPDELESKCSYIQKATLLAILLIQQQFDEENV